jgi:hypothetical protein
MKLGLSITINNSVRSASVPSLYDSAYQDILTYGTSQGATLPSLAQRTTSNQFILDLKAAGLWTKLDSLSIFKTDGSVEFALIDWKRLTTHTPVNGPTFTSNSGFTGNGSSAYINPNWNITQATQATQNSIFHGVLTNTVNPIVNTGYHGGGSNPYNIINSWVDGNAEGYYSNNGTAINLSVLNAAFRAVTRVSNTDVRIYRDSFVESFTIFPSGIPSNSPIYIMARGVPAPQWHAPSSVSFKADFWGSGLSPTEMVTFRDLLNNYIASL